MHQQDSKIAWNATGYLLISVCLLSACGQSLDSKLLKVGRCYKAGNHLRDETLRLAARMEAERLLQGRSVTINYFAQISERLNDEIFPQGRSTPLEHSAKVLRQWQTSSYCSELVERALRVK